MSNNVVAIVPSHIVGSHGPMSIPPLLVLTWLKDRHRIAIPARGSMRWSIHFDPENEALLRQIS